ncbi:hypothetical protein A2U01_0105006, partial [Trifolium medium]|nr:hypothetical protein [Trifolium medium]
TLCCRSRSGLRLMEESKRVEMKTSGGRFQIA